MNAEASPQSVRINTMMSRGVKEIYSQNRPELIKQIKSSSTLLQELQRVSVYTRATLLHNGMAQILTLLTDQTCDDYNSLCKAKEDLLKSYADLGGQLKIEENLKRDEYDHAAFKGYKIEMTDEDCQFFKDHIHRFPVYNRLLMTLEKMGMSPRQWVVLRDTKRRRNKLYHDDPKPTDFHIILYAYLEQFPNSIGGTENEEALGALITLAFEQNFVPQ